MKTEVLFDEEAFGPAAIVKKFETSQEVIKLANKLPYGLDASMWDIREAEKLAPFIEAGMVLINKIVVQTPVYHSEELRRPISDPNFPTIAYWNS